MSCGHALPSPPVQLPRLANLPNVFQFRFTRQYSGNQCVAPFAYKSFHKLIKTERFSSTLIPSRTLRPESYTSSSISTIRLSSSSFGTICGSSFNSDRGLSWVWMYRQSSFLRYCLAMIDSTSIQSIGRPAKAL